MGNQFPTLMAAPPPECVKLLSVSNLPRLLAMVQGGETAHLAALAAVLSVPSLVTLLDCVDTAADLGLLCGPGPLPLASLLGAGIPKAGLQLWCRGPMVAATAALLASAHLPLCLPMLPLLAGSGVGPVELMPTLVAGANPAVVASAVAYAPKLLQQPSQTLLYFLGHPADSLAQYRGSVAQVAATAASRRPVNNGQGRAASGATFTIWGHTATVDSPTLMMMLNEGYARIVYDSTFRTTTETSNGGDTEEYAVETWDGAQWVNRWVVHIHRGFGRSKKDSPEAAHIKRYEQRKLKDAERRPVFEELAKTCRLTNTT